MHGTLERHNPHGRVSISVRHTGRGRWEVSLGEGHGAVSYESLDEALRSVETIEARYVRCELIVHDAYGRVMCRELLFGHMSPHADVGVRGGRAGRRRGRD